MDSKKENLINSFTELSKGRTNEDLLPLLLAFTQKAKEENITFEKSDIDIIVEKMKKELAPEDFQKIETIMKMASVL